MIAKKKLRYWKIQGWDGTILKFEQRILLGQVTENSMKNLLKTLVAKHALNEDEIIGSYAKKGSKIYANYLDVRRLVGKNYSLACGDNPYFIATIEVD